jgi:hypothetical protein
MALADWRGLGRWPWRPQRAGEDLGGRSPSPTSPRQSTAPPLFLPAPEHDAASLLKVSQHNAASPRRPPSPRLLPHHVHTRLEAAPPPPIIGRLDPGAVPDAEVTAVAAHLDDAVARVRPRWWGWVDRREAGDREKWSDVVAANIFDERECAFLHDLSLL